MTTSETTLDPDRPLNAQLAEHGIAVCPCGDSSYYRALYAADGRHLGDFMAHRASERFDAIVAAARVEGA